MKGENKMAFVSSRARQAQFRIYGLFLLSDGKWTAEEELCLKNIAGQMELSCEEVEKTIQYCQGLPIKEGDNAELIIQIIDEALGFPAPEKTFGCSASKEDAAMTIAKGLLLKTSMIAGTIANQINWHVDLQTEVIWTLINLGYADAEYSEPEKKVVRHLVKVWNIKEEIVSEFVDTAETILLLTKQIEWLKSVGLSYEETKKRLETVEQQIQLMFDNIQATISEADAV
jgi:hypothetical protein